MTPGEGTEHELAASAGAFPHEYSVPVVHTATVGRTSMLTGQRHAPQGQTVAEPLYVYNATVVDVHDGDTITVNVDLGFRIWHHTVRARLAGISALELSMPGGHEAAAHLAEILPYGSPVVVRSIKVGHDPADVMSFDRYVLAVTLPDGRDLAGLLVTDGWAAPWDGNTRPVPYPQWPIPSRR